MGSKHPHRVRSEILGSFTLIEHRCQEKLRHYLSFWTSGTSQELSRELRITIQTLDICLSLLICFWWSTRPFIFTTCVKIWQGKFLLAGPGAVATSYEVGTGSWSPPDYILWPPKSQKNKQNNINIKKLIGCPFLKKRNSTKCTQGCRELHTFLPVSGKIVSQITDCRYFSWSLKTTSPG